MLVLTSNNRPNKKRSPQWFRSFKYWYYRWLRLESTPDAFARGLAAGVFSGWFPVLGVHTLISLGLATIFKGNKVVAAASTWISNPFTYLPICWFNFELGRSLLRIHQQEFTIDNLKSWEHLSTLGQDFLEALFLGSFVGGLIAGSLAYVLAFYGMSRWKQRRFPALGK